MLEPDNGEIEDFTNALHYLSNDCEKVTKKVSKNYLYYIKRLHNVKEDELDKVDLLLERIGEFLKIEDGAMREKRLEYFLGYPHVRTSGSQSHLSIGIFDKSLTDINEPYWMYKSACCGTF